MCLAAATAEQTVAAPGDFVQVHYTGTLDDGTQFDSSRGREPLEFTVGDNRVIKGFSEIVEGLAQGGSRKQRISPESAYGQKRADLVVQVPASSAPKEKLPVGAQVQLSNGMLAKVLEVTDEQITIDANPELAGQSLTFDVELVKLQKAGELEQATFGAGCFWGPQLLFQRVPGVVQTAVGYSNGETDNPTYDEVCSGMTGHAEVVQVTYNPKETSYEQLLEIWLENHDPTTLNRQGGDTGSQYRSGIYTHTEEQEQIAEKFLKRAQSKFKDPIVSEVAPVSKYAGAEVHHQEYLARGGRFGKAQNPAKGCSDPIRCYG